jgi:hypothetical protein
MANTSDFRIPAAACSFDVAIWLMERARADDSYLQPRKLHSIMFLAQALFAAASGGRRLMPSIFIFDEGGALDPNTYRAFENGRPAMTPTPLPEAVIAHLDAIWRRYADCDALRLDQIIARQGRGELAIEARDGSEITVAAMVRMFDPAKLAAKPEPKPQAQPRPVVARREEPEEPPLPPSAEVWPLMLQRNRKPRKARTAPAAPTPPVSAHDGRPLTVTKWVPGMKPATAE